MQRTDPTTGDTVAAPRAIQRAERGDHFCSFHETEAEQRRLASAFVRSALGEGDRLVYIANRERPEAVAGMLNEAGIRPGGPVRSGQVVVLDFADMYGAQGDIDLGAALARYQGQAELARADGYPALRVAVEMGDFVDALGSVEAVASWERTVTSAFAEAGITSICQYDRRLVDERARAMIAAAHPLVATDDGTVPLTTFLATDTAAGLEVSGELDTSTAEAFARVLRARARVNPRVEVDLRGLRFADLAGLRAVFEVARDLPRGSALVLRGVSPQIRRLLGRLRWQDPRVEVHDP